MTGQDWTAPVGLATDLFRMAPLLAVFAGAMSILLVEAIVRPKDRWLLAGLAGVTLFLALGLLILSPTQAAAEGFYGMIRFDAWGNFFNVLLCMGTLGVVLASPDYLERIGVHVGEYYSLLLFGLLGMMLLAMGNDLMMLFVALEIMSIAVYVLASIRRDDPRSVESGFKYFILGAFSSALLLYGIALIYGATGTTHLGRIAVALEHGSGGPLFSTGMGLVLVGFGFKVAAVPFHMWTPDVYQGAPVPVTSFMASAVKAASFAAFGRVLLVAFFTVKADWMPVLWALSALTMVLGNVAALVQTDLKRILAYSSIGHAGFALMALVSAKGPGFPFAASSLLFYLAGYLIMTVGAFAILGLLSREDGEHTDLSDLAGLGQRHPFLAAALALCLLSLAGIPPTVGFVGKFQLFMAAVDGGFVYLAVIGALSGAIGVYYYLRPIVVMTMQPGVGAPIHDSRAARVVVMIAVFAILAFGLLPSALMPFGRVAVASLGG
jgi:NADH-quinone oxidoreductase subunit N